MLHLEWKHVHPYTVGQQTHFNTEQNSKAQKKKKQHFCAISVGSKRTLKLQIDLEVKLCFLFKKKGLSFYIYMMLLISLKGGLLFKQVRKNLLVP